MSVTPFIHEIKKCEVFVTHLHSSEKLTEKLDVSCVGMFRIKSIITKSSRQNSRGRRFHHSIIKRYIVIIKEMKKVYRYPGKTISNVIPRPD